LDKGQQWGLIAHEHLGDAENRSVNQLAAPYGPERMIYGLCFKSPTYLSPYYARSNTIKIWEASFEPYLDPSQWPEYEGVEYVPDASLLKPKKGRRRKKRLKGDMDEAQGRASADYGTGDFDEDKSQNCCSKCHRFCSQCKCKKKKKSKQKKTADQTLSRRGRQTIGREVHYIVHITFL